MSSPMPIASPPPVPSETQSDVVSRPIADFHPCVWGDGFLNYTPEDKDVVAKRNEEVEHLKTVVRREVQKTAEKPLENLKLIDSIERLGVAYLFVNEIEDSLKQMYDAHQHNNLDLYHTSLRFRILRQHGHYVSSDVFTRFTDEHGNLLDSLKTDIVGLLSFYDAAYVRGNGEEILEKAIGFTTDQLNVVVEKNEHELVPQIVRALLYPNNKAVVLIESMHYISFYEKDPFHMNSLLRLSKLEFDRRQSSHKEELHQLTKWFRSFGFRTRLPFIRERVVEAYTFSASQFEDPNLSVARIVYTKAFTVLSVMDDIYDSYGTIEELEALTTAINRWDKSCIEELPGYMKLFFKFQYDTYKQFEHDLANLGIRNYVHYAVQEVMKLSKAYLEEAKWCKMKYSPTFDEYLQNGIKSSAVALMLAVSLMCNPIEEIDTKKTFESISAVCKPQRAGCIIGRFMNDLTDYKWDKHRDHVDGGVDCYVKEHGVTEEEAVDAITMVIENAWKDITEEIFNPTTPVSRPFLPYIHNLCRIIHFVYKNENGYTIVSQRMKDTIKLLFIDPITI